MRQSFWLLGGACAAVMGAVAAGCGDDTPGTGPDAAVDAAVMDGGGAGDAGDGAPAAIVARGARVLGLDVDISDDHFPANLDVAKDAGAQTTSVSFGWNDVEIAYDSGAPDPDAGGDGGTGTTLFNPGLHISNLVLGDRVVDATLALDAFDVGGSRAPADLASRSLDDPALEARYDALLDYAFDQLHDTKLTALVVASGADTWLDADPSDPSDPSRAAALSAFVSHAAAHAKTLRPGVKVGFTVDTASGAAKHASDLANAWSASDFAGLDEVPPVETVAAHPDPSVIVAGDLARFAAAVPASLPLLLRQAGYPSSAACGSDEATQAAFVSATFAAWDQNAARVFAVVFRELDDETAEQAAAAAARRHRSDAPFLALAQSLGIRATGGREKAAIGVLRREARARGW